MRNQVNYNNRGCGNLYSAWHSMSPYTLRFITLVINRLSLLLLLQLCNGCIEVLLDELNKLEHKNNDKIEYIDKIGNDLPESRRFTSNTNQKELETHHTGNNCAVYLKVAMVQAMEI